MYKIIGADGNEYGPVTVEQLRGWIAESRVNAQTRVQIDGATEWTTIGDLPEFVVPSAPVATQPIAAAAHDYHLEIGPCITRGWELVKANFGLLIGGSTLVFLAQGAIQTPGSIIRALLQMGGRHQPGLMIAGEILGILGSAVAMLLSGPLMGGLYWAYLRLLRGEPAEIGDFFAGFRRGFVNLMLCSLVTGLLLCACAVPAAIVVGIGAVMYFGHHTPVGLAIFVIGCAVAAATVVFVCYLATCWFFAIPLAVDQRLNFWDAMKLSKLKVSQHWWQVFGLIFVAGLIGSAGILLCCIGILFTMPISLASSMVAYEIIFPRRDNLPGSA
ncbi:MAG: DUF4339 domain-containing protein [Verrucomicrobiota bacterium]